MSDAPKPTRSELLRLRKRVKLARKGHDLLKKKQDALMIEFFRLLKDSQARHHELHAVYKIADRRMREARAVESDVRIRAASLAVQQGHPARISIRNVAGVRIPELVREHEVVGSYASDSLMLASLGDSYRDVVNHTLDVAARETALRRVLAEIKKVKRRSLALEKILLPRLLAQESHIRLELEERAREEFVRLKKRKRS